MTIICTMKPQSQYFMHSYHIFNMYCKVNFCIQDIATSTLSLLICLLIIIIGKVALRVLPGKKKITPKVECSGHYKMHSNQSAAGAIAIWFRNQYQHNIHFENINLTNTAKTECIHYTAIYRGNYFKLQEDLNSLNF